ncbi:MAG TPA: GNAT family N-acetyltransferase [Povalibacter sp.]|nr:GNAT family N-acetyltransferase [Povalibacter sp.]
MFALVQCDADGHPLQPIEGMSGQLVAACTQSADLFRRIGYEPPWVSYVAADCGRAVGGGAFIGAPTDGIVEIAYFTLDQFQGQGYATQTARRLVAIARQTAPTITLRAFTLPQSNPSTKILERLAFTMIGHAHDKDAGGVWEWRG